MQTTEMFGALFGLFGAFLLATRSRFAAYGWVAYLVSNLGWLVYSFNNDRWALLIQTGGFMVLSLVGIYRWLLLPEPEDKVVAWAVRESIKRHLCSPTLVYADVADFAPEDIVPLYERAKGAR